MDLLFTQALWVLGLLSDERLPEEVGIRGLEAGLDSEMFRMLACLTPSEVFEAHRLFEHILEAQRMPVLSRSEAAHIYAKNISSQILSGVLPPQDGANLLWDASIRVNDPSFHDLDTFIYAASELQSRPEDAEFFSREIIKEARDWVIPEEGRRK